MAPTSDQSIASVAARMLRSAAKSRVMTKSGEIDLSSAATWLKAAMKPGFSEQMQPGNHAPLPSWPNRM